MKIEIGGYELVYSTTILQIQNQPIKITLPDKTEGNFIFHINFIIDMKVFGMAINTLPIDKFNLQIDFINFDNATNVGSTAIVPLGTLVHKQLYFDYRVFDLVNCGKMLILNFYTQK